LSTGRHLQTATCPRCRLDLDRSNYRDGSIGGLID
jgi:hypothetical protein